MGERINRNSGERDNSPTEMGDDLEDTREFTPEEVAALGLMGTNVPKKPEVVELTRPKLGEIVYGNGLRSGFWQVTKDGLRKISPGKWD